jgi:hypothetical protein
MSFHTDVDIDLGDRDQLLKLITHVPAAMRRVDPIRKHNTGVYVTRMPYDPYHDMSTLDYVEAEDRGYFKLDLLNVWIYQHVTSEAHLQHLMREPDWAMLKNKETFKKLIHLANHYYSATLMPEPIDSIPRLAMFLAVIRPSKKHLIGKTWSEVAETVWDRDVEGYVFRKSHAVAYAHLVTVHMNLLRENPDLNTFALPE